MKRIVLFCGTLLLLGSTSASVFAQKKAPSALDFVPVVQGGEEDVQQPEAVKVDTKKHIVKAATVQDAINAAVDANEKEINEHKAEVTKAADKNESPSVGAQMIVVNGQMGCVATGMAAYTVTENVILSRISQRQAYVKAFQMAKKNLARELYGMDNEGKNTVRESLASVSTDLENLNNLANQSENTVNQALDAMLRGFVIYEVNDDSDANMIYVSIYTSPKTRGQHARPAPNRVEAATLAEAIQEVLDEVRNGLCPPVGGRIVEVPKTGETAFVGYGSAIVGKDKTPAIQAKLNLDAIRKADAFAIDSLCGLIIGDQMSWQLGISESLKENVSRFEAITAKDPTAPNAAEFKKLEEERKEHIATSQTTEVYQSARKGKLPPGVKVKTWSDDDNAWAFGIAVYIPSVTNAAAQAGREMRDAKILQAIDDLGNGGGGGRKGNAETTNSKVKSPGDKLKKGVSGKIEPK